MQNSLLKFDQLPAFEEIKPEDAVPALDEVISNNRERLRTLLQQEHFTWDNLMQPLEDMNDQFSKMWSPIGHLNAVNNTKAWRDAYNTCLPKLTEYSTELGQNHELYEAIKSIKDSDAFGALSAVQQKIIEDELRDFKLSGVALVGKEKEEFAKLQTKLSQQTTKFEENVLDATRAWTYLIEDEKQLQGLPEHIIAFAAENAKQKEKKGWLLTLDAPCYLAVMKYADDQALRKAFYEAFTTRASDCGPNAGKYDNSEVMVKILKIREQLAKLLGFNNYAECSLATKMASSCEEVIDFLENLSQKSRQQAESEFSELKKYAKKLGVSELSTWDLSYYAEKLQHEKYQVNEAMLRPYFPEDKVFSGMFAVVKHIYNMTIKEIDDFQAWNEDVRFFEIVDGAGKKRGLFYADLYAREQKRGGAWMDDCQCRRILPSGEVQTPVAYLNCNFSKPVAGKPALLSHDEVVTLFHEFGHGLHHMLTQIDYLSVSGINGVAWDAVELPSQFMENFCWQVEAIPLFSEHFETKEKLPKHLFENMLAAKNFQSGLQMLRQLEFSLFDFKLHMQAAPNSAVAIQSLLDQIRQETAVVPVPEFNRFQHGFSHIFAGGYAAGYYSYKWAEVLSSDAFSLFEENGVLDKTTGQKFLQSILERGGSKEPMDLFIEFRGRKPQVDALLIHSGLNPIEADQ